MDTITLSHVAAILIGVAVTLAVVGGFSSSSSNNKTKDVSSDGTSGKNQKKKKKKKGGKSEDDAAAPAVTSTKASNAATTGTGNNGKTNKGKGTASPIVNGNDPTTSSSITNGGGKKKKKKNPVSSNNSTSNGVSKENDSHKANTLVPASTSAVSQADEAEWQAAPVEEEWNDVSVTKKKKKVVNKSNKPAAEAAAPTAATPAAAASSTESVLVDAKKIGIIIGPKGATMQAIQEATSCSLEINAPSKGEDNDKPIPPNAKATVVISGSDKEAMAKARKAVLELASKGYATLLQSENFGESSISVHPRFLSEIVGPSGRTIQALQKTLDVKITIPSTDWKPNAVQVGQVKPCRVGIAGNKENTKLAKEAIQSLMKYHHHEITHPGLIHEEVFVPSEFFHCVIGPRGSEIKHIRGNYKVDVYMPNAESETENAIVVGRQANVDKAISYIHLLMERDTEQRQKKYTDEYYD
jgi:rRNA processing protein Krr1/Pno1